MEVLKIGDPEIHPFGAKHGTGKAKKFEHTRNTCTVPLL